MSVLRPRWPEILTDVMDRAQRRINTSLPGKVVSYDQSAQTCSVRLTVWLEEEIPPLEDVPVCWMSGAGCDVACGLAPGDEVQVLFSQFDDSGYLTRGQPGAVNSLRLHGLYARAFPTRLNDTNKMADAPAEGEVHISSPDRTKIVVKDGEINLGGDATDMAALASEVEAAIQALYDHINNAISTAVPGGADGGAQLQAQIISGLAGFTAPDVKASITKVK